MYSPLGEERGEGRGGERERGGGRGKIPPDPTQITMATLPLRVSISATSPWQPTHLREFEDVFLAVDDLECPIGQPSADVSRVEPAISVQDLPGLCLILVVALEHIGASEAYLTEGRNM